MPCRRLRVTIGPTRTPHGSPHGRTHLRSLPSSPTARRRFSGMLDGWAKEASAAGKASESTREAYTRTVRKLIAFLGYDEANRVRPEDIVAFKDARLAEINPRTGKAVSAKTVNDGDLSGLKTVFGWGVKNRKVTVNPAAGITIAVAEKPKVRPKGFTDTEAAAILRHARNYKPS